MNERFKPPGAPVADAEVPQGPSWYRTSLVVVVFSLLSLGLSWLVVPAMAAALARATGLGTGENPSPAALAIDLLLSTLVVLAACYLAARLSRGHGFRAAVGVGAVGSLVYFMEVGGLSGMLGSEFPAWYEFFPDHTIATMGGWLLARRHRGP